MKYSKDESSSIKDKMQVFEQVDSIKETTSKKDFYDNLIRTADWCSKNLKGSNIGFYYLNENLQCSLIRIFSMNLKFVHTFFISLCLVFLCAGTLFDVNTEKLIFTFMFMVSLLLFIFFCASISIYLGLKKLLAAEEGFFGEKFAIFKRVLAGEEIPFQELAEKGLLKIPGEKE